MLCYFNGARGCLHNARITRTTSERSPLCSSGLSVPTLPPLHNLTANKIHNSMPYSHTSHRLIGKRRQRKNNNIDNNPHCFCFIIVLFMTFGWQLAHSRGSHVDIRQLRIRSQHGKNKTAKKKWSEKKESKSNSSALAADIDSHKAHHESSNTRSLCSKNN